LLSRFRIEQMAVISRTCRENEEVVPVEGWGLFCLLVGATCRVVGFVPRAEAEDGGPRAVSKTTASVDLDEDVFYTAVRDEAQGKDLGEWDEGDSEVRA
jgi:hypothetical protein